MRVCVSLLLFSRYFLFPSIFRVSLAMTRRSRYTTLSLPVSGPRFTHPHPRGCNKYFTGLFPTLHADLTVKLLMVGSRDFTYRGLWHSFKMARLSQAAPTLFFTLSSTISFFIHLHLLPRRRVRHSTFPSFFPLHFAQPCRVPRRDDIGFHFDIGYRDRGIDRPGFLFRRENFSLARGTRSACNRLGCF